MSTLQKPARWRQSDAALHAVQVAFDVEDTVLEAVRSAAFANNCSNSDQIRRILDLPHSARPKRPRLTVTLTPEDYAALGQRYGLSPGEALAIKERVAHDLIAFAQGKKRA
ncbi:MAG: hypothetical protein LBL69_03660 [Zoogloeaceae bacterium]|jgi:hypothetical protein|nr:hypothetical protein [Zoogloeaceae bacterium]